MVTFLQSFNPVVQALFGTLFTWGVTALGASVVFLGRGMNRKVLDGMLGFAAGVMLAASYWSLLAIIPEAQSHSNTDMATLGAMLGFAVMMTLDVAFG